MLVNHGLGAHPGDAYYDPNRPSWVPYWFDTPTESALYYGLYPGVTTLKPTPPPPVPPPVGQPPSDIVAGRNVTPEEAKAIQDKIIADEAAAWKAQAQKFFEDLASKEDNRQKGCAWYQVMDSSDVCNTGGWKLWAVGIGAAAAAVYVMAGRR